MYWPMANELYNNNNNNNYYYYYYYYYYYFLMESAGLNLGLLFLG